MGQGLLFDQEKKLPLPTRDGAVPLDEARAELEDAAWNGIKCPCCGQFAKVYKRRLNSGMAAGLIWLVLAYKKTNTWVEIQKTAPRYVMANREMGKLEHWGLVVLKPNKDDPERKTSGLWMPTKLGVDFVHQRIDVPSHVFLYDNNCVGFSDAKLSVREALGDKFNYSELMSA